MRPAARAFSAGVTALAVGASLAVLGNPGALARSTAPPVTIQPPSAPQAGTVTLSGTVGPGVGAVTSVLYVVDATYSTSAPTGSDCSGDQAVNAADDLNGDGYVGDVLDCEISGVNALSHSLSGKPGVQTGLVAFANDAAAADLDPTGSAIFLPPGYTGGDPRPRIDTVVRSVVRTAIGLYDPLELGGSGAGTAFNNAVRKSLDTLAQAPDGPKWIMFLSDGQAPIDDALRDELAGSGVHLRSFAVGPDASCASYASLAKMAQATGESCVVASDPATLGASLAGSQPDAVNNVTVSVQDVSVAASLDAVGGWSAAFTLGAGTHTARVEAVFSSGRVASAQVTFEVASGSGGPPPGTVAPGPGALRATAVKVRRPGPSRQALPPRVSGKVGVQAPGFKVTTGLAKAKVKVLLQTRTSAGAAWKTVDRDRVDRHGRFDLAWQPKAKYTQLRVQSLAVKKYAASASAVPPARISACRVSKSGHGWVVRCATTAKDGSAVRLLNRVQIVDTAKVNHGAFRLQGSGAVRGRVIDLAVSSGHHARLVL